MYTFRWPFGLASGSRHWLQSAQPWHCEAPKRKNTPSPSPCWYTFVLTTPLGQVQHLRSASTRKSATLKRVGSLPPLCGTHATIVVCPSLTASTSARVLPQPPARSI